MTSADAIEQNFIPYPSTFPAVEFVVEHDCEMLSTCCGAGANEYVNFTTPFFFRDDFCGACNEWAEFECECECGD